jgi:hypothetical protein
MVRHSDRLALRHHCEIVIDGVRVPEIAVFVVDE